ncbi:predicted protein [Lichtheimia corymbifera JMRC:FSU:9682]|uniref:Uncharacterized protein n=1 Tax=Lichtheimia corymbifera JMRC:FSU:9682 TaxID=1263082 RepID=A0A068RHA1_9FUNG|nr:predicted protein [Lichtheimia corymbifera JMRC:FSU:9682]
MAIPLLPLVHCYSRSTVGVNRGQVWFQGLGSVGVPCQLNHATPWFSVSSNQQQRVFVYMQEASAVKTMKKPLCLWSGNAALGIIISLGSTPSLYQLWNASRALEACVEVMER